MIQKIKQTAVIGAGSMGHQISMLCALGGFETYLQDIEERSLDKAKETLTKRMNKWVKQGKISEKEKDEVFAKLHFTTDLNTAVNDADLVIEAVVEKLDVKRNVFKELDNAEIADGTSRPDKVLNMHLFLPPLVMDCVEVVKSEPTSEETAQTAMDFCEQIGRTGVLLEKEVYGFIANRLLFALSNEALFLYEKGYADYKDIDIITKKALNHPLGQFE